MTTWTTQRRQKKKYKKDSFERPEKNIKTIPSHTKIPRQQTPRYHLRSNPYPVNPHHELLEIQEPLPEPNLPTIAQVLEEAMDQFNQPEPQYLDHIAPPAAWEQEEINYQVIAANYQFPGQTPGSTACLRYHLYILQ